MWRNRWPMDEDRQAKTNALRTKSHMPDTVFYEKIIPALLILMGVIMVLLILFGLAVLLGYVRL